MTSFSIFNLNVMHGRNRKSAIFPLRLHRQEIQNHLQKIVDCIHEHSPDIITLQEVDQFSLLSGSFNQFDFLGTKLRYPYKYYGPSCSIVFFGKSIFVSGNAIFSRYPLKHCESHTFNFSFPTDRMGFVIADIKLRENQTITLTSLHLVWLDWLHSYSRLRQLELVKQAVTARGGGIIIAGDFNCDLQGKEASLRTFVSELDLGVYEPNNENLPTSPAWSPNKRIDFILSSKDMRFTSYTTLADILSDHLAILAHISLETSDTSIVK